MTFMPGSGIARVRAFARRLTPVDAGALGIVVLFLLARVVNALGLAVPLLGLLDYLFVLALIYFAFRLTPWVRGQLMWSLRNRLIVAYVFIAVVPVVLLLTMAGIAAYLIYVQLGAHILRDGLAERMHELRAVSDTIAHSIARETVNDSNVSTDSVLRRPGVADVVASESAEYTGLTVDGTPADILIPHGEGHERREFVGLVDQNGQLWIQCFRHVRVARDSIPLRVSLPVSAELLDSLPDELGPIHFTVMKLAAPAIGQDPQRPPDYIPAFDIGSRRRQVGSPLHWLDPQISGALTLEALRVDPGKPDPQVTPIYAGFLVRPSRLNSTLFASVGAIGPLVTLVFILASILFILMEAAALVTGIILTRRITSAVSDLYDATRYVRRGDFTRRVRVQRKDQLGVLAESFNEMTSSIGGLIEEQRQRQRLENEITIAREVQLQLFPQTIPQLPGVELAAICKAARMVSGDYYDFILLSPSRVAILLADISGKGISASLLMASLQAALRSLVLLDPGASAAQTVARLNLHLCRNTADDHYATLFYGIYDSDRHTLEYTNAGHCVPFLVSGESTKQLEEGGTVVGLFEEAEYESVTVQADAESLFVTFSDGLTEPMNVFGEEFGSRRLLEEVLRHRAAAPGRIAEELIDAAEQWGGADEQADDMTVIVARLNSNGAKGSG
jgi:sigma-B regulation protein RsbU (phosphoserine phosphatase)